MASPTALRSLLSRVFTRHTSGVDSDSRTLGKTADETAPMRLLKPDPIFSPSPARTFELPETAHNPTNQLGLPCILVPFASIYSRNTYEAPASRAHSHAGHLHSHCVPNCAANTNSQGHRTSTAEPCSIL